MLKSRVFRTLLFPIFNWGRFMFHTWINIVLIYLLLIKECFEILLLVSSRLKRRLIWIVKELGVDNLWHALWEEVQSKNFKLMNFKSNGSIYMCQNCRVLNRAIVLGKTFNLKTPLRKTLSDSTHVRESTHFNKITSSTLLHLRDIGESSKTQGEPSDYLTNKTLRCLNKRNCSKTENTENINERRTLFKDASTSSLKYQNATPESSKLVNKIFDVDKGNFETKLDKIKTSLNSPSCLMSISQTPTNELNFLPRKSRLELMFSNEDLCPDISPERESFIRKSWKKCKRFSKLNFGKKQIVENDQTRTCIPSTKIKTSKSDILEKNNIQTPEVRNCCGVFNTLKTKFNQNDKSSVLYKRF